MPWQPAGSVAVVVAQQFNPSVMNQVWLVKRGVLEEDDLLEGSVFSDMLVQVRSRFFHMLVLPEQMQFVPAVVAEQQQELLIDKVGTIVQAVPHTPYRGLGLNFNWHLKPGDGDLGRLTRELFATPDRPLYSRFGGDNARFGAYLSKDFCDFRLKLDVKPINVPVNDTIDRRLQFAFNFHAEITEGPDQIVERLGHWNEVRQEAKEILEAVEPGLQL